jgi:hypothetical protein
MPGRAYRFNDADFAYEAFADEILILNVTEGTYFALAGAVIDAWPYLAGGQPLAAIADALAVRYGVTAITIEADLAAIAGQLADEGILAPTEANAEGFAPVAGEGEYRPSSVEKHVDMEDLLTLDPIHDVDQELGWPKRPEA